jgi:hypothetical protein
MEIKPLIEVIKDLVAEGVLSDERCPQPEYWHWDVLKPEALDKDFARCYDECEEIRWNGFDWREEPYYGEGSK